MHSTEHFDVVNEVNKYIDEEKRLNTMKNEFIFLGPPACGKGTQTSKLEQYFNLHSFWDKIGVSLSHSHLKIKIFKTKIIINIFIFKRFFTIYILIKFPDYYFLIFIVF